MPFITVGQENSADIRVETLVEGSGTVTVELLDAEGRTAAKGEGENASLHLDAPHLWNGVKDPYLYTCVVRLLQDGQPAPRARVIVAYDNEHYQKRRIEDLYDVENVRASNITADENGQFSITPTRGGLLYLFVTLHKRVQPDRWESHNAALTLEAALQP